MSSPASLRAAGREQYFMRSNLPRRARWVALLVVLFASILPAPRAGADCAEDKGCSFPYVDGNCVVLGCCGGDGERQCCTGCIGSEAPSACAPGNVIEADLLCHTPCQIRKGCSFAYDDGNCPVLGCCGGDGERQCCTGCIGSSAPSACAPGLVPEADLACHVPCPVRNGCSFPYGDGNCPTLGCCGGEGERICVVGLGSDAPSECQPGLIANAGLTCQRPRTIGEDCGPGFPCLDSLQCVPFAQKCAPPESAGDQIIDEASCLALFNQDQADLAASSNSTMSYGLSTAAAAVAGGSYEVGNVYGQDGRYGCFLTYCYGVESDVSISSSVCAGISDSWESFVGDSFVTVGSAGAGVEFTTSQAFEDLACFTADPSPPCLNGTASCIGVGIGLIPFSVGGYQCMTIVNTVIGGDPANTPPTALCKSVSLSAGPSCSVAASIDDGSSDPDAGDMIDVLQTPPGPFGPGARQVTLAVKDTSGAADTCTATVTVTDDTAPTISGCPMDITVNTGVNSATCGHSATWMAPTASDNCGVTSFTPNFSSGSSFPVGETTVTYTAKDAAGLSATCSFKVKVVDNTVPTISSCPSDVAAFTGTNASACSQTANWIAPTASDNCDIDSFTPSNAPGSTFPVGSTTVNYTATDTASLTATCSFKVNVLDNTAPVIGSCPSDRTVYTGPGSSMCSQTSSWAAPSAFDNCLVTSFTSSHASGAAFSIGETAVNYTAKDAANNSKLCSFKVTAVDNTAPLLTCPDPISVEATSSQGATVPFTPTASDNCSVNVVSSPTAGSLFPIGTTTVNTTATDPSSNQVGCSFTVHVIGADLAITKTAAPDPVTAGTDLTYTIQVANDGPDAAANVTVSDQTPPNTTFGSMSAPSGWSCTTPAIGGTGAITCTKASVANGEMAAFELVLNIPSGVANETTITNEASVGSTTQDPEPLDNEATSTVSVTTSADLVLTRGGTARAARRSSQVMEDAIMAPGSGGAFPLVAGSVFDVAFTVINNGASDAQMVMVSAPLPTHILFLGLTSPGGWSCTTPALNSSGLVKCSLATMVAGTSASFNLKLQVDPAVPSHGRITGTVTASSATGDPTLDNNFVNYYVDAFVAVPLLRDTALWVPLLVFLSIGLGSLLRARRETR